MGIPARSPGSVRPRPTPGCRGYPDGIAALGPPTPGRPPRYRDGPAPGPGRASPGSAAGPPPDNPASIGRTPPSRAVTPQDPCHSGRPEPGALGHRRGIALAADTRGPRSAPLEIRARTPARYGPPGTEGKRGCAGSDSGAAPPALGPSDARPA